jgi:hypothetical protein
VKTKAGALTGAKVDLWLTRKGSLDLWGIALQQLAEAEPLLVNAEQRLSGLASCPRRHYLKTLESLAQLYDARQMPDEAKRWREKMAVYSKAN